MHNRVILMFVSALPASVFAHGGTHDAMHGPGLLQHLLGQHLAPALLVVLAIALLAAGCLGARRACAQARAPGRQGRERHR